MIDLSDSTDGLRWERGRKNGRWRDWEWGGGGGRVDKAQREEAGDQTDEIRRNVELCHFIISWFQMNVLG